MSLPASLLQRICYTVVDEHASNWCITASKALGDGLNIRDNTFVLPRVESAASAHSGHDLVDDQECSIFIADGFHGLEVARHGGNAA